MAKAQSKVASNEVEVEETEAVVRPSDLAKELDISPKVLRSFLRKEFPRATSEKNTSWVLTQGMVEAATEHFTASDEEDEIDLDEE